jgi:hypothetical protein
MFIMWLPPVPVSSEGLFQNGLLAVVGCVNCPCQLGVVDENPDGNAENLPVGLVIESANTLPLSNHIAAEATKIGFIKVLRPTTTSAIVSTERN